MDPVALLLAGIGELANGFLTSLVVAFGQRLREGRRRRELEPGHAARFARRAAEEVAELRRTELAGVPDGAWREAVAAAGAALRAAAPVDLGRALALDLRPELLERHVRTAAAHLLPAAVLGDGPARQAFDRILAVACAQVFRSVMSMPDFAELLQVATFQEVRDVRRALGRHALGGAAPDGDDDFERRYLDHIARTLGSIELFGIGRGRAPRAQSIDAAYVSPAVARGGQRGADGDDDELTGAGVDVASAMAEHRRVLIRGGAGAGKTTLLRWLAVSAARDTLQAGARWGGAVPFFVQLRHFTGRELPDPEALPSTVARVIAGEMPAGWVSARLRAGRALLLVDGVDELAPAHRHEARNWLEQLAAAYGDARYVVTTRPFAVGDDWLAAPGFVAFDLLPMSPEGTREFLAAWHDAARAEHAPGSDTREWLDGCERSLAELVATRPELRRLAANPLLCGLLCALYLDRNMHLPIDRKGLYDAALDLLLVRWDEQRGVRVDEDPALSKEEQLVLLQRFAYSLVKNEEIVVSRADAARRIAHAMRGLRSHDAPPGPILQRTLERTGLLREPNPDEVQFVHRTFRDHLAAKEVVDAGDLGFLVEHAHLDHWHDVVVMAVAHARPSERDLLLQRLVRGNAAAQASPAVRDRLHLVAAACLEQAHVMDTNEVRELVERAAARLIPPATPDDAELLARAGAFVLDLLPGPAGLSEQQAACVVRAAAMIGGPGVREKLAQFVDVDESGVIDELLRAWRRAEDPEDYARTVLAQVDFGDRRLEVRGWHRVRCLPYLTRLTTVACYGDFGSLDPLAAAPRLRRLELIHNELVRNLAPLAGSRSLRSLHLTGCPALRDLSPLGATAVEELGLHLMVADLDSLRGARLRSLSIRDPRIRDGLGLLPAELPLRELTVDNLPTSRNLAGVERWEGLERVSVRGVPRADEIEALAALPRLRELVVRGPVPAGDLARLGSLDFVPRLTLDEVPAQQR